MLVLGIESSCDDTGIALVDSDRGLLVNRLRSQVDLHSRFGGVVPELASRDHVRYMRPLVQAVVSEANCNMSDINAIAYTRGPGLAGGLLVASAYARTLAWSLSVPHLGVNHLEAHIHASMLEEESPRYPFVALLVSGGHSQLVLVKSLGEYRLLGETLDDAVGEAFDKVAKMLGLPYPGGPHVAKLALQGKQGELKLPVPMQGRDDLMMSFSGLKTAVSQCLQKQIEVSEQFKADLALAFEEVVVKSLVEKCVKALKQTDCNQLVLVGGVAANIKLRSRLKQSLERYDAQCFYPRQAYCTDNGAMIAYLGLLRLLRGEQDLGVGEQADVLPRWPLIDLTAPEEARWNS